MDDILTLLHDLKQQITQDYAEMNASVQRSIDKVDDIFEYIIDKNEYINR